MLSKKKQGTGTALDGVLKEIGVMKQLQHPNCVQLWEVIDDPAHNHMYLVMEFIEGGDLAAPINRKAHPLMRSALHPVRGQRPARLPGPSAGMRLADAPRSAPSAAWRLAAASAARATPQG